MGPPLSLYSIAIYLVNSLALSITAQSQASSAPLLLTESELVSILFDDTLLSSLNQSAHSTRTLFSDSEVPQGICPAIDDVPFLSFGDSWELEDEDWGSGIDVTVRVPNCAGAVYSFQPLPYNWLGTGFYDLQFPYQQLDADYVPYPGQVLDFTAHTYGREHIYEVQLIAMFMDHLRQYPGLRTAAYPTFCPWLRDHILTAPAGGVPVLDDLLNCLPNNHGATPSTWQMPWLQSLTNGAKASALNGKQIRLPGTFIAYNTNKKISVIRGVAAVLSYLNTPAIAQDFIDQSNCVRTVWSNWYLNYIAQNPGTGLPFGMTMMGVYSNWIQATVQGVNLNIGNALNNMINWFQASEAGGLPLQPVAISYDWASVLQAGIRVPRSGLVGVTAAALRLVYLNWWNANQILWWALL